MFYVQRPDRVNGNPWLAQLRRLAGAEQRPQWPTSEWNLKTVANELKCFNRSFFNVSTPTPGNKGLQILLRALLKIWGLDTILHISQDVEYQLKHELRWLCLARVGYCSASQGEIGITFSILAPLQVTSYKQHHEVSLPSWRQLANLSLSAMTG